MYTQSIRERIAHYAQRNNENIVHPSPLNPSVTSTFDRSPLDTPKVYLRLRKNSQMIKGNGNNVVHRRPLDLLSGHE